MKKIILSGALIFMAAFSFGQDYCDSYYDISFDNSNEMFRLTIDTSSHPDNIWQVGRPQKNLFTSAYSAPKAIVTDTLNPYPTNDTSIFIITNVACGQGFEWPHTVILAGQYYANTDSLNDFGKIEFSPDRGVTWFDLLNDTVWGFWSWNWAKPVLTGNSNGWQYFGTNLSHVGYFFGVQDGDTVLYRFTFISDSVQTNKDGLMFDNLHFEDWVEGIDEIRADDLITISPNPASEQLNIRRKDGNGVYSIKVLNQKGQIVYNNEHFNGDAIDTRSFTDGHYLLKCLSGNRYTVKKFVVLH